MRTLRILMLAAAILGPMAAANAAELPMAHRHVVHARWHRLYHPRVHYGYYWYQWGWRTGGTARSWLGSSFAGVTPWWW